MSSQPATQDQQARGVTARIARHPVVSIVIALGIAFGLAAGGQPPTSNEGEDLAPSAPALQAADRIDELFPERSSTSAHARSSGSRPSTGADWWETHALSCEPRGRSAK